MLLEENGNGTVQVDMNLPSRFNAEFINEKVKKNNQLWFIEQF